MHVLYMPTDIDKQDQQNSNPYDIGHVYICRLITGYRYLLNWDGGGGDTSVPLNSMLYKHSCADS